MPASCELPAGTGRSQFLKGIKCCRTEPKTCQSFYRYLTLLLLLLNYYYYYYNYYYYYGSIEDWPGFANVFPLTSPTY